MLYDGAARRVEEIKAAIAAGDVEARYRLTRKAAAIVDGLQACLDHEQGARSRGSSTACTPMSPCASPK